MGISASIYAMSEKPRMGQFYTIFTKDQFEEKLIIQLEEVFGDFKGLHGLDILFIGDGEKFKGKNVLKDYDINEGVFTLKEGLEYLVDKGPIVKELEEMFNEDINTILDKKNLILSLDY
jgi:hypothetical protein